MQTCTDHNRVRPITSFKFHILSSSQRGIFLLTGLVYLLWIIANQFALPLLVRNHAFDYGALGLVQITSTLWVIPIGYFLSRKRISLTSTGMRLPLLYAFRLGGRFRLRWDEIVHVDLETHKALVFRLSNGATFDLKLYDMKNDDLQEFLQIIYSRVRVGFSWSELSSFTKLWEYGLIDFSNSAAYAALQSGHVLQNGNWIIEYHIGYGGFSAVYLARGHLGELYIIKESSIPTVGTTGTVKEACITKLFEQEAKILSTINHPKIPSILDYFVEQGRHYLVMEYFDGESMRQRVSRIGPQEEKTVVNWILQIVEILDYLHSQSPPIVHNDISPDNLIIRDDGSIVLVDFGSANYLLTRVSGHLVGKPAYMALEQIQGSSCPQSDFYSLGATLFFVLTGLDPQPISQSNPKANNNRVSHSMNNLVNQLTFVDADKRLISLSQIKEKCHRIQIANL